MCMSHVDPTVVTSPQCVVTANDVLSKQASTHLMPEVCCLVHV